MKSLEVILHESLGQMTEAQQVQFYTKRKGKDGKVGSIESQINLAESILHPVKRNNGRLQESGRQESSTIKEADLLLYQGLHLSEAEIRKLSGQLPAEVEQMSEKAQFQFKFGLGIGLSEADAIRLAKKEI
jgi:hypothetical protein